MRSGNIRLQECREWRREEVVQRKRKLALARPIQAGIGFDLPGRAGPNERCRVQGQIAIAFGHAKRHFARLRQAEKWLVVSHQRKPGKLELDFLTKQLQRSVYLCGGV